jgi:hypothetical protein
MSPKKVVAIFGMGVIFLFSVAGCSDTLSRSFYSHHPRSVQDIESVWGQPVDITSLDGGIEKRTYMIQSTDFDLKYRYFLIKDGKVLASGITDTGPADSPEIHRGTIGFVASDLSKAFYDRHQTTTAHLDQTWGKPLRIEDGDNGMQYRVYEINDRYSDFRFRKFLVKDGFVVASRISPETGLAHESGGGDYRGVEINEISHRYYQRHPMPLEAVETTWGEPVSIRKTETGLEKRTYKLKMPTDAAFAYRFFIIDKDLVVSSGISDTLDLVAK